MSELAVICPIMSTGLKAYMEDSVDAEVECEKIRCQWWEAGSKRCAVFLLAINIEEVTSSLYALEARLSDIEEILIKGGKE